MLAALFGLIGSKFSWLSQSVYNWPLLPRCLRRLHASAFLAGGELIVVFSEAWPMFWYTTSSGILAAASCLPYSAPHPELPVKYTQRQRRVQAIFKCPTAGYFEMSRFNASGFPLT
jgi:hypothetical protein